MTTVIKSLDAAPPAQHSLDLFAGDHTPSILKKPIEAIQVAIIGGYQNRTQRLAFNLFLQHAHKAGMDIEQYGMPKREFVQLLEYGSRNIAHLKKTLVAMQNLRVEWDVLAEVEGRKKRDERWASVIMMHYVAFDDYQVYFEFDKRVKQYLFDPETYANLDLNIQKRLTLDTAFVLYEWAVRYRNINKTRWMSWQQWRTVLYADPDHSVSMQEYREFKRRKLVPAIQELNELTDLHIELVENKRGTRSVQDLQFRITEKPRFAIADGESSQRDELDVRLTVWGLSNTERRNIFQHYALDVIEANIEYVAKRLAAGDKAKPIKSVRDYFKTCIKRGYGTAGVVPSTQPAPSAKERKQGAPLENVAQEKAQQQLREFHEWRNTQAMQMFSEMHESDRLSHIEKHNAGVEEAYRVPTHPTERTNRLMIPFFAWLAQDTWGNPDVTDVLAFTLRAAERAT